MRVVTFPTKYPSGGEKQLIEILTGKQVPSRGLPADIGIVCHNIGTAVAIKDAVCLDQPLISRITTVTGEAVKRPRNYHVLIGTPVSFLLEESQYQADQNNRLIMGGPMMGFALADISAPIIKTSNCILAPTEAESAHSTACTGLHSLRHVRRSLPSLTFTPVTILVLTGKRT